MEAVGRAPAALALARDLGTLTKPKVQSLLLLTTICAMEVADSPSAETVILACLGGALSAGGAGAINHVYDRDIDARMGRTANRPIAAGRITPAFGVAFGLTLCTASFILLATTVNTLAACLALSGFLGYVGVYTMWLKRTTPQNIVIGGAAGGGARRGGGGAAAGGPRARPRRGPAGRRPRAASTAPRSTCSRSSSSGPRRTSGRCPSS